MHVALEVNQFELKAVTLLLTISNLSDVEKQILTILKQAAEGQHYWETLSRLHGQFLENGADWDAHLANIKAKAAMAGLTPKLEELR